MIELDNKISSWSVSKTQGLKIFDNGLWKTTDPLDNTATLIEIGKLTLLGTEDWIEIYYLTEDNYYGDEPMLNNLFKDTDVEYFGKRVDDKEERAIYWDI